MLQKGAEYIKQLKAERNQIKEEMESLRQQIECLNNSISCVTYYSVDRKCSPQISRRVTDIGGFSGSTDNHIR